MGPGWPAAAGVAAPGGYCLISPPSFPSVALMTVPLVPCPTALTTGTARLITSWQAILSALLLWLSIRQALLRLCRIADLASR